MLHKPLVRLIVQGKTSNYLYYPKVLQADVTYAYPLTVPTANIDIITNMSPETSGYISPISIDDIVRLQVSITFSRTETVVWTDIFEGRVRNIQSPYGTKNTTTLDCAGHIYETTYSLITNDYNWGGTFDAVDMLGILVNNEHFLSRLSFGGYAAYVTTGVSLETFSIKKDQKYMHDILMDLEKISQHTFQAYTESVYDNFGKLTATYLCWKPFSDNVNTGYKIIEGTHRLLDAEFNSSSEEMYNSVRIYGDTYTTQDNSTPPVVTNHQYTAIAGFSDKITEYGKRSIVETVTGIKSNSQCSQLAVGFATVAKDPFISGRVSIFGTPHAKVGDLVYVKIPSLEINGASIQGNYRVVKVNHSISQNKFVTNIDFGKLKSGVEDYIVKIKRKTRINNCNHIRY